MATVTNWNPYGVNLNITAVSAGVTRTSATEYEVKINVSWSCSGTWNHMKVASGGASKFLYEGSGASKGTSDTIIGAYSISGNGSATKTITVTFYNMDPDNHSRYKTNNVTFDVTVPAWTSYAITYDQTYGAFSSQTKWKDQTLTLRSTSGASRTGYTAKGWSTSSSATSATWASGGSYTANAAAKLYVVWIANTYKIVYNGNGNTSGSTATSTHTYNVTKTLTANGFSKTYYNFVGWNTRADGSGVSYADKQSVKNLTSTNGATITLYAQWELAYVKPRLNGFRAFRFSSYDDKGNPVADDTGDQVYVEFAWETDFGLTDATITWQDNSDSETTNLLQFGSGDHICTPEGETDGFCYSAYPSTKVFSTDTTYIITVTIRDSNGYTTQSVTVPGAKFAIDFKEGGTGAAFGKPAELDNVLDIAYQTRHFGGLMHPYLEPDTNLDDVRIPNTYVGANVTTYNYSSYDAEGEMNFPFSNGTFTLDVKEAGVNGQVWQRITLCDKTKSTIYERFYYNTWGNWVCTSRFNGTLLWDGQHYMSSTQTAELSEPVSKQTNGIVLVFSLYEKDTSTAKNQEMFEFFISKHTIAKYEGSGRNFNLCGSFGNGVKYLYLWDDKIVGNDRNSSTDLTVGGITYDNTRYVLRNVIGV